MTWRDAVLLLTGVVAVLAMCVGIGFAVAAVTTEARVRARRRRAVGSRPPLEFTSRARLVWTCMVCGLSFKPWAPAHPPECPNPRCRAPWLWSSRRRFDA